MRERTWRTLAALNREFYSRHAAAFCATRRSAWRGWARLLPALAEGAGRRPLRVLDAGCGNGRFARFLVERLAGVELRYCGVDASAAMLAEARRRGPPGAHWECLDFALEPARLPRGPFDCVALFGVLHGIPGRERRLGLLRACAERLAPGGLLALTLWRLGDDPRLLARALAPQGWARVLRAPLDPADLDPGDCLLPWGDGADGAVRYVNATPAEEARRWEAALAARGLVPWLHYRDDGRRRDLNDYRVFRAPA